MISIFSLTIGVYKGYRRESYAGDKNAKQKQGMKIKEQVTICESPFNNILATESTLLVAERSAPLTRTEAAWWEQSRAPACDRFRSYLILASFESSQSPYSSGARVIGVPPSIEHGAIFIPTTSRRCQHALALSRSQQRSVNHHSVIPHTVKMAFAPAMKHIACSASVYVMRPAAKRTMDLQKPRRCQFDDGC